MIRLITATPGSGKTCIVIEWLLREIDRGFYKEFYTNIEGLTVCGVRPLPDDCDWRKLNPEKSKDEPPKLLIIDECQYISAFMKENRSVSNSIGKDLSTHRHYGIDIWFITQSTKLLNDYVLENVGEHVHLFRPRKSKNVQVYWWSYVQKTLTKSAFKDADDKQVWRLNPNMFKYYKSTSNVTDSKARISQKVVFGVISFIFVAMMIVFFVSKGLDAYTKMKAGDALNKDSVEHSANMTIIDNKDIYELDGSGEAKKFDDEIISKDLPVESTDFDNHSQQTDQKSYYSQSVLSPVYSPPIVSTTPTTSDPFNYPSNYSSHIEPTIYVYNYDTGDCIVKNKQSQIISKDPKDCKNKFKLSD